MSSDFKSNAAYSGEFAPIKLHYGSWKNNGSCSRRHVVGINCEEKRWLIIILILSSWIYFLLLCQKKKTQQHGEMCIYMYYMYILL